MWDPLQLEYVEMDPRIGSIELQVVTLDFISGQYNIVDDVDVYNLNRKDHPDMFRKGSPYEARNLTEVTGLKTPKFPDQVVFKKTFV